MTSPSNSVPQLGPDTAITATQDGAPTSEIGHPHPESMSIDATSRMEDQDDEDISDDDTNISIDSNDDDSAIGDLLLPRSTTSIESSAYDYIKENGRKYHRYKEGSYVMPTDETEQDRLNMQHDLWYMTLDDQLLLAPITNSPRHVLDIGTGTGIWAIEFAREYPSASVIGTDLSPTPPPSVPSNCQFEVGDVEDEWNYSQKFDLIHGRLLVSCFKDPRVVLKQAYENLAPGGYLEMQDADFPMSSINNTLEGTSLWKWNMFIVEGAAKAGRPWTRTKQYKKWMEEIGFVDVEEKIRYWPVNTWPRDPHMKKLGLWFQHDLIEGLNSTRAILIRGLGWSNEQVEVFLENVRKDVRNKGIHAYTTMHIVYGRKLSSPA